MSRKPSLGLRSIFYVGLLAVLTSPAPAPVQAPEQASVTVPVPPAPVAPVAPAASPSAHPPAPADVPKPKPEFRVLSSIEHEYWLRPGEYIWNDEKAPKGELRVVVDVPAQHLYVYRAGHEIGRAFINYGADNKPTPRGTFPILQKKIDHVSNLYDAPMPYMLRLTWDGIAIHGGSQVDGASATNGCIGLPDEFASLLFKAAKLGDTVVVTDRWRRS